MLKVVSKVVLKNMHVLYATQYSRKKFEVLGNRKGRYIILIKSAQICHVWKCDISQLF